MQVGVDVGGTFTDVLVVHEGSVTTIKTPSTPEAPAEGVVNGLERVGEVTPAGPPAVESLSHATTVATNAVLEDDWAPTALVTTAGFEDVLEIGRQDRPDLYDLRAEKPTPVVPRRRRHGVPERVDPDGAVREPLDESAVRRVAREVAEGPAEAVAVCLLNGFENDAHERRVREILAAEAPGTTVTLASEVLPELREYERSVTTAMSAGLEPVVSAYLSRLEAALSDLGVPAALNVMQSTGGVIDAGTARRKAVNTLLSGPAAGVQGAAYVGARAGDEDLITMDMGGTSCDVSLVPGGDPVRSSELTVGGYPVRVPMLDVHTIGSGGGSLARVDAGGALRVGPESAGADPGPVCYGRGGEDATVTDAHALLGRIDPGAFLGDDLGVPEGRVREAFEPLCAELGRPPREAAADVLDVANANMERALNVISTERGRDPRAFTLVAFGGAGPLHGPALARRLGVERVLVPRFAGVLSALGLLVADTVSDHVQAHLARLADLDAAAATETFERLEAAGRDRLDGADVPPDRHAFEWAVDARYVGQSYELTVEVPRPLTADDRETVADRFHDRHRRRYGHASPAEPVEVVSLRVTAVGAADPPALDPGEAGAGSVADARRTVRPVVFGGRERETPVYDRGSLPPGGTFDGPAVVEGADATAVVFPDQRGRVDDAGNLVVEAGGDGS
jgi:N-methylhydantoinase A